MPRVLSRSDSRKVGFALSPVGRLVLLAVPLGASFFFAPLASAQTCPTDDETTMCMNQRLSREFEAADKKLNLSYQKLMKQLAGPKGDDTDYPAVRASLIDAQRNWLAFRDSDCKGQYTLNVAGTLRDAVYLTCKIDRTNVRTKQLDVWMQGD